MSAEDAAAVMQDLATALNATEGCPHEERHKARSTCPDGQGTKKQTDMLYCRACGTMLVRGSAESIDTVYAKFPHRPRVEKVKKPRSVL